MSRLDCVLDGSLHLDIVGFQLYQEPNWKTCPVYQHGCLWNYLRKEHSPNCWRNQPYHHLVNFIGHLLAYTVFKQSPAPWSTAGNTQTLNLRTSSRGDRQRERQGTGAAHSVNSPNFVFQKQISSNKAVTRPLLKLKNKDTFESPKHIPKEKGYFLTFRKDRCMLLVLRYSQAEFSWNFPLSSILRLKPGTKKKLFLSERIFLSKGKKA